MNNIRNFSIIAHIDHGKSTLADRMLELTGTVEKRKMKAQVLDSMDLERERGITIKMQPVRMEHEVDGQKYILNLIDTPGHIDFSYEVSRALKAVEGSILLVDATQGVQAQTLTTLGMARELGLVIIPVVTKIDSPLARPAEVKSEIATLLECAESEVLEVSGKTGDGVVHLLSEAVRRVPPPKSTMPEGFRALIFDFEYSSHKGVVVYVRILDGEVRKGDALTLIQTASNFEAGEAGIFHPAPTAREVLRAGEIGYIVTGVKEPGVASVGDTITSRKHPLPALAGYKEPHPVVWASVYPESQDDFADLKQALARLRLSDPSISFEEEASGALGRGFRCGFLGMLHLEIIMERMRREFDLELIMTTPSTTYEVEYFDGRKDLVYTPSLFPDHGQAKVIMEPWIAATIITPPDYIGPIMQLLYEHEAEVGNTDIFGDNRVSIEFGMPLRELMRGFFDELKSASSGFGSLSYELAGMRPADVVRLDILIADEVVPAFSKVISRRKVETEAQDMVEKLHAFLPRQLFVMKVQARALGRILASRSVSALRKDVLMKGSKLVGGGDVSRKRKLLEKQKKGKKKMLERGRGKVNIPHDVFLKMVRGGQEK